MMPVNDPAISLFERALPAVSWCQELRLGEYREWTADGLVLELIWINWTGPARDEIRDMAAERVPVLPAACRNDPRLEIFLRAWKRFVVERLELDDSIHPHELVLDPHPLLRPDIQSETELFAVMVGEYDPAEARGMQDSELAAVDVDETLATWAADWREADPDFALDPLLEAVRRMPAPAVRETIAWIARLLPNETFEDTAAAHASDVLRDRASDVWPVLALALRCGPREDSLIAMDLVRALRAALRPELEGVLVSMLIDSGLPLLQEGPTGAHLALWELGPSTQSLRRLQEALPEAPMDDEPFIRALLEACGCAVD